MRLSASQSAGPGLGATLVSGVLLGCAISLIQTVQQPIGQSGLTELAHFVSSTLTIWCAMGVGWALVARWTAPWLSAAAHAAIVLGTVIVLTVLDVTFDRTVPVAYARTLPLDARAAYVAWTNLFYGGLYMTTFVARRQLVLSRRRLARIQQARDESAALLDETRLDLFRRQLQPETILGALSALRRQYADRPNQADHLLDEIVGFLRAVVRNLHSESSDIRTELDLAARYLTLRSFAGGGASVAIQGPPPAGAAFPPRVLTPMLEHVCLTGGRVSLTAEWRDSVYRIDLSAEQIDPRALPEHLARPLAAFCCGDGSSWKSRLFEHVDGMTWALAFEANEHLENWNPTTERHL